MCWQMTVLGETALRETMEEREGERGRVCERDGMCLGGRLSGY